MNQKPSPLHRASEWIVDHYRLFFVVFAALLVFSAVASGWVKVENDVAAYLPADSETRQGLDIMEQEFQTYGSAKILLRDTDADAAAATAEQIRAVDGVDSCTYTMNDTGSALLSVSLSDLEGSDTCAQTVQALRDLLDGSGAYIYSAEGYSISDQINGEVRGLLVIVAIILVTVLTFTSSTYAEALCGVESLDVLLCQANSCFQVFTHQVFRFLLFLFRHCQRGQHHFIKFFFIIQHSTVSLLLHTVNNTPHRIKQILRIHHRTFQNLLPLGFIGITNQYHNDMFLKIYA